jgi:hypothetical protein
MMQKNKDFTLIIHGPLTIYTMFTLYRYVHDFDIVVVAPKPTIKNNIVKEIDELVSSPGANISLVLYGDVMREGYNNVQNKYLHFFSVNLGLNLSSSRYIIKMRSDEFYSNLTPFMESVKKYPNKITTNDVFFRNSKIPFHPSDHLVGGTTENMKLVFQQAKLMCEVPEVNHEDNFFKLAKACILYKTHKIVVAEQYLGIACLKEILKTDEINEIKQEDLNELMKKTFNIVPSERLGVYRIMYNSKKIGADHKAAPEEYFDQSYFNTNADIKDIDLY